MMRKHGPVCVESNAVGSCLRIGRAKDGRLISRGDVVDRGCGQCRILCEVTASPLDQTAGLREVPSKFSSRVRVQLPDPGGGPAKVGMADTRTNAKAQMRTRITFAALAGSKRIDPLEWMDFIIVMIDLYSAQEDKAMEPGINC